MHFAVVEYGVAMCEHISKRDDNVAIGNPLEYIWRELAQLTERVTGYFQLALDR